MRVFLAGATGAIGQRLVPLLVDAGHAVTGTTRSADRARELERAGVAPAVLDVFDAEAVTEALRRAQPEVVIHQLTDLPREFDQAKVTVSARRLIVQSIAFAYVPGGEPHPETDPLNLGDPARAVTVKGAADMEQQVLGASGIEGIVLRYGLLYGPATWYETPGRAPGLHVDAAAQAALLAITRGARGIYNIADDDGAVSIAKARAELGFDPQFRLR
jgi:nucleoside-diphosphate-sugar epimerase